MMTTCEDDSETESERHFDELSDDDALCISATDSPIPALSNDISVSTSSCAQAATCSEELSTTDPAAHQSEEACGAPDAFQSPFASLAHLTNQAPPAPGRCGECKATLCLPGLVSSGVEPACCDCCRRVVPVELIDPRPSGTSVSLCVSCHARYVVDVDDDDSSERTIDARWIKRLEQLSGDIRERATRSVPATQPPRADVKLNDAVAAVAVWTERAADLKIRQRNALLEPQTSTPLLRKLYHQQVTTDQALLKALTTLVVVNIDKMIDNYTAVPRDIREALESLWSARQMPAEVAKVLARTPSFQAADLKGDVMELTRCMKCKSGLVESEPTGSKEVGYCDCCQRVLPMTWIAVASPDLRSTVCSTCHAAHLNSQDPSYYDTLPNRLDQTRVQDMTSCSTAVQSLLATQTREGISAATRTASDRKVDAAQQKVIALLKQSQQLLLHEKKTVGLSYTTVSVSQALYTDRTMMDSAVVDALMHLLRVQAEAVSLRRVMQSENAIVRLRSFGIHVGQSGFILSRPKTSKKRVSPSSRLQPTKVPVKKRKLTPKPKSKTKPKTKPKPKPIPKRQTLSLSAKPKTPKTCGQSYVAKKEPTSWLPPMETKVKSEPLVKNEH